MTTVGVKGLNTSSAGDFVRLRIRWKINDVYVLADLVRRVNADAARPHTPALGEPVPVVAGDSDPVAGYKVQLVWPAACPVFNKHHLDVAVLTAVVVDVVQRMEVAWRVRVHSLHQLVGHAAYLNQSNPTLNMVIYLFNPLKPTVAILVQL